MIVDGILPITGNRDERKEQFFRYGSAILNLLKSPKKYGYNVEDIKNYIKVGRWITCLWYFLKCNEILGNLLSSEIVDQVEENRAVKEISFAERLYQTMVGACQSFSQIEGFLKKESSPEKSRRPRKISFGILNYGMMDVAVRPRLTRSQSKPILLTEEPSEFKIVA